MNKLIDYDNFLNWCKLWNKKPNYYSSLKEFQFEINQYNKPIERDRGELNG